LLTFYGRAKPVARERNPTAPRVPIRQYANTPIRRYADTPIRRYADTSTRVPNCGLSLSSKLNSKNNDSTKVWENLTEVTDGYLPCQPLDWIRSPPL
jgi:hypothetical protein